MTTTKELEEIRANKRERLALEGLPLTEALEPLEYYQTPVKSFLSFAQVSLTPEHTLTKRLLERRISLEVIEYFEIAPAPDSKGWIYPAAGSKRWKNADSHGKVKYAWKPSKPESAEFYHGADLAQAIATARGACWLVSGEPDVWALRSAGIAHALSGYTESHVSRELAQFLSSLGVTVLYIAPDRDETGESWSGKVAAALAGSGIELDCRVLPAELGEHGDLGKAWQHYTKLMDFERWLIGLPRVYPEPVKASEPKPQSAGVQSVVPDDYRLTIIARLGVREFKPNNWSKHNVICPFHKESRASASVHEYKGIHCKTEGAWHTWQELGKLLEIGSIAEWRKTHQAPAQTALSNELRAALVQTGSTATARTLDALYLLGWQPGKVFSRADAIKALSGLVASWTIRQALEPETTKHTNTIKTKVNYCGFFPSLSLQQVTMEKCHNKSNKRGRQSKSYKLPAPGEIAEKLGIELSNYKDPITKQALKSRADYEADVMAVLPRAKPGTYSRKTLAARVNRSARTTQSYCKRAGLKVTERFERELLTVEKIAELPERLEPGTRRNTWLENGEVYTKGKRAGKSRRFEPTKAGAERALSSSPTGELWLVKQLTNHYQAGSAQADALQVTLTQSASQPAPGVSESDRRRDYYKFRNELVKALALDYYAKESPVWIDEIIKPIYRQSKDNSRAVSNFETWLHKRRDRERVIYRIVTKPDIELPKFWSEYIQTQAEVTYG